MALSEAPLLEVAGLDAGYGKKQVLHGVGLSVAPGEAIAVIGHNGAGKTTALRAIFGLQHPWAGQVRFNGEDLGRQHTSQRTTRLGMAMIPSERFVFPDMTVLDNLRLATQTVGGSKRSERLEEAFTLFPVLADRRSQRAGTMSGGEQRMVSLAMALITRPRLLLLDEPSLGLSPVAAEQIIERVRELVASGMSLVLVEQNVAAALGLAHRAYVLRSGEVILEERSDVLLAQGREHWVDLF